MANGAAPVISDTNIRTASEAQRVSGRRTYMTLDGMRGIAALCVMLYHFSEFLTPGSTVLPKAYLAVDMFFILSGFVIAHAYDARLSEGKLTLRKYALARFIRLYPLYIASIVIGAGYFALRLILDPAQGNELHPQSILLSALFLPELSERALYHYNPAAWSLFFELLANFAYALLLPRLSNRVLWGLVIGSGVGLAWYGLNHGSLDVGMYASTIFGGALRVTFSFFAGVLIWRHRAHIAGRVHWLAYILPIAIISVFAPSISECSALYDLVCVMVIFPIVICLGSAVEPSRGLHGVFRLSADLSYPMYVLHTPLLLVVGGALTVVFGEGAKAMTPTSGLFMTAVVLIASYIALHIYDTPVRRYLNGRLKKSG